MIGEVVGGYRVTSKLGEGGMGVVYLAEHTIMGRRAVVKILRPQLSDDEDMVQRFFNEARAAGAISHPGIVGVFDLGTRDDGSAFIIMDYLEGESLAQRLATRGRLSAGEALAITRQILSALSAAHAKGIVHRDLKPDNIFLTKDAEVATGERVKLLDFGIAKLHGDLGGSMVQTKAGAVMGTPIYMSPEQCRGGGECDKRTDIYSVGVMLFELLTGRPPFVAETLGDLMAAHIRDAPPRLAERLGQTPEMLENLVATFLAKSPDDRYASGEVAIAQIDAATAGVYASSPAPAFTGGAPSSLVPNPPTDPLGATLADPNASLPSSPDAATLPRSAQGTTMRDSVASISTVRQQPAGRRRMLWTALGILSATALVSIILALQPEQGDKRVSSLAVDAGLAPVPGGDAMSEPDAVIPSKKTPRADRLPAIDISGVSEDQILDGKRLHQRALKLHRAGDYEAAFAAYEAVQLADPGHLSSRYDYSCALNLGGQRDEGLAILRQLKNEGCAICLGRLIRARGDVEWKSAWDDPAFVEITQGVALEQPSPQESAQQIRVALTQASLEPVASLFHPRSAIVARIRVDDCEGKACSEVLRLLGYQAARDWIEGAGSISAGEPSCRRDCCSFAESSEAAMQLDKVCTVVDSGSVRTISSLHFTRR